MRKISADIILTAIILPMILWFISFIFTSYQTQAEVESMGQDISEIKQDVKEIRNYLLEKK